MMPSYRSTLLLFTALTLACSGEPDGIEEPPPTPTSDTEVVIHDDVFVVDAQELDNIELFEDRIVMPRSSSDALPFLYPGAVLATSAQGGILRRVVEIEETDTEIVALTEPASLTEVFEEATFRISAEELTEYPQDGVVVQPLSSGTPVEFSFDDQIESSNAFDIQLSGDFSVQPDLNLSVSISGSTLQELSVDYSLDFAADLSAHLFASADFSVSDSANLWSSPKRYSYVFVGPVPLVISSQVVLRVGYTWDVDGEVEASGRISNSGSLQASLSYTSQEGWTSSATESLSWPTFYPSWSEQSELAYQVYLQPQLNIEISGILGPYLYVRPAMHFDSVLNPPSQAECDLYARLSLGAGMRLSFFDYQSDDYSVELLARRIDLASCGDLPLFVTTPPITDDNGLVQPSQIVRSDGTVYWSAPSDEVLMGLACGEGEVDDEDEPNLTAFGITSTQPRTTELFEIHSGQLATRSFIDPGYQPLNSGTPFGMARPSVARCGDELYATINPFSSGDGIMRNAMVVTSSGQVIWEGSGRQGMADLACTDNGELLGLLETQNSSGWRSSLWQLTPTIAPLGDIQGPEPQGVMGAHQHPAITHCNGTTFVSTIPIHEGPNTSIRTVDGETIWEGDNTSSVAALECSPAETLYAVVIESGPYVSTLYEVTEEGAAPLREILRWQNSPAGSIPSSYYPPGLVFCGD